jgi:hypothetical protein
MKCAVKLIVPPWLPLCFRTRILVKYPGSETSAGCAAMGTVRNGSSLGNRSTLNIEDEVVVVEGYVDDEAIQFVMIWFSSGVKDDFDVEVVGLRVGKDGCSSDCKASESSRECEREWAFCAMPKRSDTLWRRR